jgi:hypothetical protein
MSGVRVGTRVGRRGWVSAPWWLVLLGLPFIAFGWAIIAALWLAWIVVSYSLAVLTWAVLAMWHRARHDQVPPALFDTQTGKRL